MVVVMVMVIIYNNIVREVGMLLFVTDTTCGEVSWSAAGALRIFGEVGL